MRFKLNAYGAFQNRLVAQTGGLRYSRAARAGGSVKCADAYAQNISRYTLKV